MKKTVHGKIVFNYRNQHTSALVEIDDSGTSVDLLSELISPLKDIPVVIEMESDHKGPISFSIKANRSPKTENSTNTGSI